MSVALPDEAEPGLDRSFLKEVSSACCHSAVVLRRQAELLLRSADRDVSAGRTLLAETRQREATTLCNVTKLIENWNFISRTPDFDGIWHRAPSHMTPRGSGGRR